MVNAPKGFDLTSPPECTGSLGSVLGGRCRCDAVGVVVGEKMGGVFFGFLLLWGGGLSGLCFFLEDFCSVNFSNSFPAGEKHSNDFSKFG